MKKLEGKFDILEWFPVLGLFRVKDNVKNNKKIIVTEYKDSFGLVNSCYHGLIYIGVVTAGIVYLGTRLTN